MGNFNQKGFANYLGPLFNFFLLTSTWSYFLPSFNTFCVMEKILDQ